MIEYDSVYLIEWGCGLTTTIYLILDHTIFTNN
jgi:hypothetical protein